MDCCFVTSKTAGRGSVWVWCELTSRLGEESMQMRSHVQSGRAAAVGFLPAARHAGGAQSSV